MTGRIRVGIGGWVYEPWRGSFYPVGMRQKDELAYVGVQLTATEINATYYSSQKPATFAGWAQAVPDGFQFAVKASRFCYMFPQAEGFNVVLSSSQSLKEGGCVA